jgi:hypothetical protein
MRLHRGCGLFTDDASVRLAELLIFDQQFRGQPMNWVDALGCIPSSA